MALGGSKSIGRRCVMWFKHCLLVTVTVGLECSVTLEVIFMIANIQTLGVHIRYSSLPGTISAAIGVVLIPTMGLVMDKWAKSKSAKALILIGTTSLEIIGNILIFTANSIKLFYYDDPEAVIDSTTSNWSNNSTTTSPYPQNVTGNTTLTSVGPDVSSSSWAPPTQFSVSPSSGEENVHYFAILAMIGYCFLDCGYDSSNCFLKTFALASTSPKDHSSIIVKSVFVSSFGGCLIAVLGSIGLGGLLTVGTTHDGSAAQTAFVAALCLVFLLSGLTSTLTTGFCCSLSGPASHDEETYESHDSADRTDEKSLLIASEDESHDLTSSPQSSRKSLASSRKILEKSMSGRFSGHAILSQASLKATQSHVLDDAVLTNRTGIIRFAIRYKKQILVNLFAFFTLGSLYSFEVYAVNFVGNGIFNGNPQAPVGSESYQKYLDGIAVGSQGTLIYYSVFTVCSSVNEVLLNILGWKLEVLVAASLYVVVNLLCALTVSLWSYYVAAVWTGIYRAVVMTVPYILANKFANAEDSGKDTGVAIAMVAAMLPCGFSVCSALMGPLIDVTGNPATPLYYTAITTFLGLIVFFFLRNE